MHGRTPVDGPLHGGCSPVVVAPGISTNPRMTGRTNKTERMNCRKVRNRTESNRTGSFLICSLRSCKLCLRAVGIRRKRTPQPLRSPGTNMVPHLGCLQATCMVFVTSSGHSNVRSLHRYLSAEGRRTSQAAVVKRGGGYLLTEILLPRNARLASNCSTGNCLSSFNKRTSSKNSN